MLGTQISNTSVNASSSSSTSAISIDTPNTSFGSTAGSSHSFQTTIKSFAIPLLNESEKKIQ